MEEMCTTGLRTLRIDFFPHIVSRLELSRSNHATHQGRRGMLDFDFDAATWYGLVGLHRRCIKHDAHGVANRRTAVRRQDPLNLRDISLIKAEENLFDVWCKVEDPFE
jgi:hypothetical protein